MIDWPSLLNGIEADIAPELGRGAVATYIPALAEADPSAFAMTIAMPNGKSYSVGQADTPFSIQSISKIFTLTIALQSVGDALWERVGREPSGTAFNSIVQLEQEKGVPRNPFINAGAIVTVDAILNAGARIPGEQVLAFVRAAADDPSIAIDQRVAASEEKWGDRNRSLAFFMKSFGVLRNDPQAVLSAYFAQCAIAMSTAQLAKTGLYLVNKGDHPTTGVTLASHACVNRVNALMLTCGHYDMSGDFAFRVGLPGKSGVGGGILAVVPDVCSVAVWSPGLNDAGNSYAGTMALEMFSKRTGLNLF